MVTGELKSQVDKIWNAFWMGGISNPLTVIEQFTYLLFMRRLDEWQMLEEKKAKRVGIPMKNPFFTAEQQALRWSHFQQNDPQMMFELFTKGIEMGEPGEKRELLKVIDHHESEVTMSTG